MIPQVDPLGRIYAALDGVPVSWNFGIGFTAAGAMCTTGLVKATDTFLGGFRLDPVGRVIVADPILPVTYNGGLPFNANGALARYPNTTPAASDPYVRGIRVGTAGVYTTSASPPTDFTGFSNGFSDGFGA